MTENEAVKEIKENILPCVGGESLVLSINALEKQIPKKPKYTHIEYGKHTWKKNENREVDEFAFDYEYHSGVYCEICGKTVCTLCNQQYDELNDCEDEYYNCPSCGKKIKVVEQ